MGRSHKVQILPPSLLLSTLVERRCCRIQATLLRYKKRCQSGSRQKLYFGSVRVRVSPVSLTLFSGAVVFSFHCGFVKVCSSFNDRTSINECKQVYNIAF